MSNSKLSKSKKKQRDLDKLADAFFCFLDYGDDGALGVDGKRPFGWSDVDGSILRIIKAEPEDVEDGGDGVCEAFWSSEQEEYASDLYDELRDHLRRRWRQFRKLERGRV